MSKDIKQTWNKRSKKYVLIDCGKKAGIVDMQDEPFPGVEIINENKTKIGGSGENNKLVKKEDSPQNNSEGLEREDTESENDSGVFDIFGF